jgi:hypothetical protein
MFAYEDLTGAGINVVCFADRNFAEYPDGYNDIPVCPYDKIPTDVDAVIVTPEFYFREIFEMLTGIGISADKIISLAMLVS